MTDSWEEAMDIRFDGRTVIVTGAGGGLGRAYALELGRRGANVVVNDLGTSSAGEGVDRSVADAVVKEITDGGGRAIASHDTVASDEGAGAIAATALDAFGRVDGVVHNAGIHRNAMFDDLTVDQWFPVLETHLFGAYYLSRAVWPGMREQQFGRMVFVSSGSGAFGRMKGANYASAKAGMLGLCNALALEGERHGILANAILPWGATRLSRAPDLAGSGAPPGADRTAMYDAIPRFGTEWAVPMVVYLASEACTHTHRYYSNGGGRYARVFVGATAGWRPDADDPPTVEDIASHIEVIDDNADFDEPISTSEELQFIQQRYG